MNRLSRIAPVIAVASALAVASPAKADLPTIDFSQLIRWGQQAGQMVQTINGIRQTVGSLTDIPQELVGAVQGLLNVGIQNPLQNITGNLQSLMNGSGTGTCTGSAGLLAMNQYHTATGGDFMGSWLNGGASINAGLQACTQRMMQATQDRLDEMPQLLEEVKACHTQSCATALGDRIQLETATINAQQQQAQLVMMRGQLQRWTAEDQILQKQRSDYESVANGIGGGPGGGEVGGPSMLSPTVAPSFSAGNFGG